MAKTATQKKVFKKFKMRGYNLRIDAVEEILSFITRFEDEFEDEAIDLILDDIQKQTLKSSIVDRDSIQQVITLILKAEEAANTEANPSSSNRFALRVIDAFVIPKFKFDSTRKVFYEYTGKLAIHGEASAKDALYRERFQLLVQRLSRHPNFAKPAFDPELTHSESGNCQISQIQSLIGCKGMKRIMGVISQLEDGHFYLEDLTAAVPVNFLNAKIYSGFFVENTIIVAEGELLTDGIFQVTSCGFPPLEDRDDSLAILEGFDFFGGGSLSTEEKFRLSELEKRAVNDMFVVFSDVWLDHEKTMEKLTTVLDAYEELEVVPYLFVLMGNFCSRPCNLSFSSFSAVRIHFTKLGELIGAHPRLKEHSTFLFIPGPDDAGPSTVLPRCALPHYLTEELQKHIPHAIFSSNPCRIKFCTQEIVIFRQDLLYRMRRSCLIPPSTEDANDPFQHLVTTIILQSHLCPLPLTVQPILWNYDHCLRLYPTPHTIILGDRSEQKEYNYKDTTCFNTGSFANDNTFAVYRPCSQEVELSAVPV